MLTAYSAILAGIFTTHAGFKNSAKADVVLGSNSKKFKSRKLETIEIEKQDGFVIFPIDIINKGNGTTNKVYIDIEFKEDVQFEMKSFTHQPKGGLIREYPPDLSCADHHAAGWVNQTIWPKTTIDLGRQNWIYINPYDNHTILINWKVKTMDSERKGEVQLNII